MSDEPKISQRYRDLPRDEPSPTVDAAILAAARRAAETRPAPLVVPSGRRRWYFPLAAAAIIVLAVAVTMHVEREQPDPEAVVPPVTGQKAPQEEQFGFTPDPKPELRAQNETLPAPAAPADARGRMPDSGVQGSPAPAPKQERESPAGAERRALEEPRMQRRYEAPPQAPRAPTAATPAPEAKPARRPEATAETRRADEVGRAASVMAKVGARSPEQWLQGIADLRRQGRHEEADRELAEFRRAYPDYRLSEEMRAKVERDSAKAR